MKSKFILLIIFFKFFLFFNSIYAENVTIKSQEMSFNKDNEISTFKKNVKIQTEDNSNITSNFAQYNKKLGIITLKGNIIVNDSQNNTIKAEDAEYLENKKILRIIGPAEIITAKNYILNGKDITLDDLSKKIVSNQKATIIDKDDNKIYL